MLAGLLTALVACLGYGSSSVLQAYGASRSAARARARGSTGQLTAAGAPTMLSTLAAAGTVPFVIGTGLDVVGFVGGAVAARLIPLFLSQTILSANLIVTAVLGTVVLGIRLGHRDWLASASVLAVGVLVVRRLGSAGAVAAGLLFGGLAIAVRIVHGVAPVQFSVLLADPAAWAIAVAGVGGFYLHTVALQMGSVNGATAPW